jgi:outer membrane protein assembly factor BamB
MKQKLEKNIIPIAIFICCCFLFFWLFYNPVKSFTEAVPGLDNRPARSASSDDSVVIGEKFNSYVPGFTSSLTGNWPQFRGPGYDNISREKIKLIDHFPEGGPVVLWKKDLGEGHAAASIYNGRVYVMDYDERKKADVLHCYSLVDGTELWRRSYTVVLKRNHGMSRTIPAVNDKYVVTIGPRCHVMCCNSVTGDLIWGLDPVRDYKATVPLWYTGQCPVIDNNVAIIATGGTALMMGVDCATGKVLWKTPNPDSLKMSHSSVVPMTIESKKMYVYNALGGLFGVSAEGDDIGKILWKAKDFSPSVIAPSPVKVGGNRIFVTAGYGAGSALYQVTRNGEIYSVQTLQIYKPAQGMASEQQTPIFTNGYVFNIQPKDAGTTRNEFVCCKPDDFKNILWTSSTTDRFGLGPYILADNKFFILSDEGDLTIARFSTTKFEVLDKVKVIEGQDSWGPLAIADGMMVLRDSKQMVCVDLKVK